MVERGEEAYSVPYGVRLKVGLDIVSLGTYLSLALMRGSIGVCNCGQSGFGSGTALVSRPSQAMTT